MISPLTIHIHERPGLILVVLTRHGEGVTSPPSCVTSPPSCATNPLLCATYAPQPLGDARHGTMAASAVRRLLCNAEPFHNVGALVPYSARRDAVGTTQADGPVIMSADTETGTMCAMTGTTDADVDTRRQKVVHTCALHIVLHIRANSGPTCNVWNR